MSKKLAIAMFGQKRLSREGGVEIVVKELCTRMAQNGCDVTCYNRAGHHVSGAEYDDAGKAEYEGIRQKSVPTIERRGLAAVSSSAFAALYSAFGKYDVVHIHAEGPAFFAWLPKMFGKRVVVTVHGIDWQREKWQSGLGSKFIHQGEKNAAKYADEVIVPIYNVEKYLDRSVPCCCGIILVADQIVEVLFGVEFLPAISTIRILSILIVLMPLSGGVFCQLLLTAGKEKSYLACVLIGTVVNSYDQIAMILTQKKRSTLRGRQEWNGVMVANIMKNERRWGDLEARKSIVVDYKLGKVTKNNGNRCSAYVPEHHEAIVSPEIARAAHLVASSSKKCGVQDIVVIRQGALKGFVGIHPNWNGINAESIRMIGAIPSRNEVQRELDDLLMSM